MQSDGGAEFLANNPQVGPVFVEGAEPGDMLAVKIDSIQVTRGWAWSRFIPGFGVLGVEGEVTGPTGLNPPLPEMEFRWTYNDDLTEASIDLPSSRLGRATIPLHPVSGLHRRVPEIRRDDRFAHAVQSRCQHGLHRNRAGNHRLSARLRPGRAAVLRRRTRGAGGRRGLRGGSRNSHHHRANRRSRKRLRHILAEIRKRGLHHDGRKHPAADRRRKDCKNGDGSLAGTRLRVRSLGRRFSFCRR